MGSYDLADNSKTNTFQSQMLHKEKMVTNTTVLREGAKGFRDPIRYRTSISWNYAPASWIYSSVVLQRNTTVADYQ